MEMRYVCGDCPRTDPRTDPSSYFALHRGTSFRHQAFCEQLGLLMLAGFSWELSAANKYVRKKVL